MDDSQAHDAIPIELLDRYLAGDASPSERTRVAAWIAADPHRASLGTLRLRNGESDPTIEAAWNRVSRVTVKDGPGLRAGVLAIPAPHAERERIPTLRNGMPKAKIIGALRHRQLRRWLGVVSTASVFGAILTYLHNAPPTVQKTRVYMTGTNQQATIVLDDRSRVTLSPNTTLRLVSFGERDRSVALDGEAFFDVTRASGAPFVVRSGQVSARVLGTKFLVRHQAGSSDLRVAVLSGKVQVAPSKGSGITVTGHQIAEATDSAVHVNTLDALAPDTDWMSGQLVFRHALLTTVLQMMNRWYGLQFRLADEALAQQRVTLVLSTESSAEALAAIEDVLTVNLTVVGDTVTLTPHGTTGQRTKPRTKTYDLWTPNREVGR